MFNFRQKILITYVIVFLMFIGLMFPFAEWTVTDITRRGMRARATELISRLKSAPDDEALVRRLKEYKSLIFFRVSIISNERKILYDSHTKRIFGPRFSQEYVVAHPEVIDAFEHGSGYNEEFSELLGKEFAYYAQTFDFHGKTYVLRTAFPLDYVNELSNDFTIGVVMVASGVLLLYSLMTWFIINHFTRPIQQIIEAVRPYQEGETNQIPMIPVRPTDQNDEFGKLAKTLNTLSVMIQSQISSLTEERNEKMTVLESLVEGVLAVDDRFVVIYANQIAAKMLHVKEEELIGQDFRNLKKMRFSELLENCLEENQELADTIELKRRGRKIYLDIIAAPMKDQRGAILVMQDKSPMYKAMEMRRDFVANASHELKTPITIIRGFAEMLHDNPNLPQETQTETMGKIVKNCERMSRLIKDLLTLSDVEQLPESRLENCNLFNIVEGCVQMTQDAHRDATIELMSQKGKDFSITGDPRLLDMAFLNLIENAAKYSEPPAEVSIEMEHMGDWIKVVIADKGVGIPEEDLDNIFLRFYRVDKSRSKRMGGSGLGLSIVQTIIDKHFGKISVDSELDKGTTFTVLLPVSR